MAADSPGLERTLLDTSVLSDFLQNLASGRLDTPAAKFAQGYLERYGLLEFSVITRYETRRGLLHLGDTRRLKDFDAICLMSHVIPLDFGVRGQTLYPDVWRTAEEWWAELRAHGITIKDADLLIAATAAVHGYALATRDKDFVTLEGRVRVIYLPRAAPSTQT